MKTKPDLSRQLAISLAIVAALVLLGFTLTRRAKSDEAPTPPAQDPNSVQVSASGQRVVEVRTAPVRSGTLSRDLSATGAVSYPADQIVKISPRLQGRIRQVFVRVGDHVAAGQTLAVLDSLDAATAQTAARQNENKLRLAQTTLERTERLYRLGTPEVTQAQSNLDQAVARTKYTREVLDRLQEQAKIGGFTEKPLEDARTAEVSANSTLAQAQADLAQAQKDYDRKVKLVEIGVAAKSDLEAAENVLAKAKVNVQAGKEQLALATQAVAREEKAFKTNLYALQSVRSGESDYRQAQLQEDAARTALRLARTAIRTALDQARSDYQAAQADAENSRHALDLLGHPGPDGAMNITAPESGLVIERDVNPGQVVDQSQETPWQMFVIANSATVWVDADVYEKDISTIAVGQPAQVRVTALPGRIFTGRVLHIAPTLDKTSRAIKVRAEIANPDGLLRDGMFADVTVMRPRGATVALVPLDAILHDGEEDYVYVADGKKYVRRKVRLGPQRNGDSVVLEGLKSGETVVTHGALFLGSQANDD
jgi:cobalt-zinc-cadmium efflux system membrane fusion protein